MEVRVDGGVLLVQPLVLVARRDMCVGFELVAQDLDRHVRVCDQVVELRRMGGRASFGRDDDVVIAVPRVHERVLATLAGLRPPGGEYQHVTSEEGAGGGSAPVGA